MNDNDGKYSEVTEKNLIRLVLHGDKEALNSLICRHKDWIYNVALRMTGSTLDAEEVSQEILIKVITKLSTFKFKSSFQTWVYRITANHVNTMKKRGKESLFTSFDKHRRLFDTFSDDELPNKYPADRKLLIEETKTECMLGMLLCLDRSQRIVFTLGGIFGLDSKTGSKMLELSEANYRKRLSRARQELKNYMNQQCSLLDETNSCKCSKKTKAAIQAGYVNPGNLKFNDEHMKKVKEVVLSKSDTADNAINLRFQDLFKEHPYKIFEATEFLEMVGGSLSKH
ncbi:MAG: RNA polymerase sigma factor [bacterium]|nr:RNA polymerase sigma factor [bacterium]